MYWPWCGICVGITLLVGLLLFDASFGSAAELLLIAVGIRADPGMDLSETTSSGKLAVRVYIIAFLIFLVVGGVVADTVALCRDAISLWRLLMLVALVCVVAAVCSQWKSLMWQGFRLRNACRSKTLLAVCIDILSQWPPTGSQVSPLGCTVIVVEDGYPDLIGVESVNGGNSFVDRFGPFIRRVPRGIIIDSTTNPKWKLEYHADGSSPVTFETRFDGFTVVHALVKVEPVCPHLYVAEYDEEYKEGSPEQNEGVRGGW